VELQGEEVIGTAIARPRWRTKGVSERVQNYYTWQTAMSSADLSDYAEDNEQSETESQQQLLARRAHYINSHYY